MLVGGVLFSAMYANAAVASSANPSTEGMTVADGTGLRLTPSDGDRSIAPSCVFETVGDDGLTSIAVSYG